VHNENNLDYNHINYINCIVICNLFGMGENNSEKASVFQLKWL